MPPAKKAAPKGLPLATDPAQILNANDLAEKDVEVPEWGCSVRVRGYSLKTQQDIMDQAIVNGDFDDNRHSALMLIYGIVQPEFSPDQVEQLRGKSLAATNRVITALNEVNGAGGDALASAEREFLAK